MAVYTYRAKDSSGVLMRGAKEAEGITALRVLLKSEGLYLITAKQREGFNTSFGSGRRKFRLKELALINNQLSSMLLSGLTLSRALDILYQQTENSYIRDSARLIYEDVQKGRLLSEALKLQEPRYPRFMINLIRSGEASGTLGAVCERLSGQYENEAKIHSKILSALIYPMVLLILIVIATSVILIFVFPVYMDIYNQSWIELPVITKSIMSVSDLFVNHWLTLLLCLLTVVTLSFLILKMPTCAVLIDRFKLKIPFARRVILNIAASRFSRTMANLISGGMPLITAIEMSAELMGNGYIEKKLLTIKDDIKKGASLGLCLKKADIFPPVVYSMAAVGEESGNLSGLLNNLSVYMDREVETSTQRLITLMEPLIIILLAFTVGIIVIGMIMPMFDMYSAIETV
ncbi:MAG: type II secretion system F family protein [Clostridiales bacterium]|jgi:type IV pilus assembly protein PilC|nr:type II secretion system F family protein [Clostridiales bacterium]